MEHPPFFTVEEGQPWHDKIPGLHCENLFIKDRKSGIWLVVMPADKRVDLGRLDKALGAPRFSFTRPDVLQEVLALTPGSVTPLGLINDTQRRVTVILDDEMLESRMGELPPATQLERRPADAATSQRLRLAPTMLPIAPQSASSRSRWHPRARHTTSGHDGSHITRDSFKSITLPAIRGIRRTIARPNANSSKSARLGRLPSCERTAGVDPLQTLHRRASRMRGSAGERTFKYARGRR